MAAAPKKPWVAFLLSIAYLGKWGWAVLNLLAAFGIGIAVALTFPDAASPVGIGVLVGSAVFAKNLAEKMNKESAAPQQSTGIQPPPVITVSDSKPAEPIMVKSANVVCPKCGASTEVANFCAECSAPLS